MHTYLETETCIICSEKARFYTGAVMLNELKITAGWCKEHVPLSEDCSTWKGKAYSPTMGLKLCNLYKEEDLKNKLSLILKKA